MFGRSKPKAFKPYTLGATKPPRKFPRWLLWLTTGVVIGAGGLVYVQQEHMAPRLSAGESQQLTAQAAQLSAALQTSQAQLAQAGQELAARQAQNEDLASRLETAQSTLKPLQDDLALLQEVLPPDPRGGALQVRAGRFFNENGGLSYHLVLTREETQTPFQGTLQFIVEGRYPNGRTASVTLDPLPLKLDAYQNVHGAVPLPEGMQARQITTRILNSDGRMQAMRVINSRS